jgi:invasion protein IalB
MTTTSFLKIAFKAVTVAIFLGSSAGASELLNNSQAPVKQKPKSETAQFSSSTSVFDSWSVHCRENANTKRCYAETILRSKDNPNREILRVRINKVDDGYIFIGTMPEGIALDVPFVLSLNEENRYPLSFRRCQAKRCTASDKLDSKSVSKIVSEDRIIATFFTFSRDEEVSRSPNSMALSTKGLKAALKMLAN